MRATPGRREVRGISVATAIVFAALAPQTARAVPLTDLLAGGTLVVGNVRFSDFVYTSSVVPPSLIEIRPATTEEGVGFDILGVPTAQESLETIVDVNFQLLVRASVLDPTFRVNGIAMALDGGAVEGRLTAVFEAEVVSDSTFVSTTHSALGGESFDAADLILGPTEAVDIRMFGGVGILPFLPFGGSLSIDALSFLVSEARAIPEPSVLPLLAAGIGTLAVAIRRHGRRTSRTNAAGRRLGCESADLSCIEGDPAIIRTFPFLAVVMLGLSACAPSVSPQSVVPPSAGPVGDMRRLVVVASGDSKLTMPATTNHEDSNVARVFGEIAKWYPKAALWGVLATAVQRGIDWLVADGRSSTAARQVSDISPGTVVADAFTRALVTSGQFDRVRAVASEPIGDDRREMDALVRIIVPVWGLVRVREGKPDMMAAYADVRAQIVVQPTSTIVWEHDEDVTHGERLPLQAFTADSALSRQVLLDVLERAGQRLANELLYARSGGR